MKQGTAIIIGAGPAGLPLQSSCSGNSAIKPIVIEANQQTGGISRTIRYKGNRMDIGGHRFFSKSDRVMRWWLDLMPVEAGASAEGRTSLQGQQRDLPNGDRGSGPSKGRPGHAGPPAQEPHLFSAPLLRLSHQPDRGHFQESRPGRTIPCGVSYLRSALLPQREERR